MLYYLVNDSVPCETSIVHDYVNLAIAKLRGLLHQLLDVVVLEKVTGNRDGLASVGIDPIHSSLGFGGVDVRNNNLGSFIGEESGTFGADALGGTGDDDYLAGEKAFGVVEVAGDLLYPVRHGEVMVEYPILARGVCASDINAGS